MVPSRDAHRLMRLIPYGHGTMGVPQSALMHTDSSN